MRLGAMGHPMATPCPSLDPWRRVQSAGLGQPIEQQVEIHQAGLRPPSRVGRPPTNDDTPICRAIPAVHQIASTTPQCPHREIESERRHLTQPEGQRCLFVTHFVDSAH